MSSLFFLSPFQTITSSPLKSKIFTYMIHFYSLPLSSTGLLRPNGKQKAEQYNYGSKIYLNGAKMPINKQVNLNSGQAYFHSDQVVEAAMFLPDLHEKSGRHNFIFITFQPLIYTFNFTYVSCCFGRNPKCKQL